MPPVAKPLEERFWNHVHKTDGCWLWTAGCNAKGYGVFNKGTGEGKALAHRMAYEFTTGASLDAPCLLHRCDVRNCVNPAHLHPGTRAENNQDMREKGRAVCVLGKAIGEDHPQAKLTEHQVQEIRNRYRPYHVTRAQLARSYGVSRTMIGEILARRSWQHVD
jgi:hypothetical protein